MRKVTIEDISRETGLSRGTVSRALNDRPDISPDTRQRVLSACTKLNYIPSHAARSLATGRHYSITAVIDDFGDPLSAAILRGAVGVASARGYVVPVRELTGDAERCERTIHLLSAERIDGALLIGSGRPGMVSRLRETLSPRPIGLCGEFDSSGLDHFESDTAEALRVAVRIARERGARRIAVVWDERAANATHPDLNTTLGELAVGLELGECSLEELITFRRPLFSATDVDALILVAANGAEALLAAHVKMCVALPSRGLIVIGTHRSSRTTDAAITYVQPDGEELGRRAAEALLERIGGQSELPPRHARVAPLVASD